jgi:hypothetical protein
MLFLHISGKCPVSLVIPPSWPPIPKAHVLHVFFEEMDLKKFLKPTFRATAKEYFIELKPETGFDMVMKLFIPLGGGSF